jgi:hypothetical protein
VVLVPARMSLFSMERIAWMTTRGALHCTSSGIPCIHPLAFSE